MKESVLTALSYLRSIAQRLNLDPEYFAKHDFHLHVPAGATPKDGPSAGITMFTALASLATCTPVKPLTAMTGEITLRGEVLPIGGLKQKALAAYRAGIKTVIFPKKNEKDLVEIPKEIAQSIQFIPVDTVDQVLEIALGLKLKQKKNGALRKRPDASRICERNTYKYR
jgi:ATP-dependent Lon protease